jgi:IS605 OrfB family transposase
MIKKYKRINSGFIRRTSRIYLKSLNKGKKDRLYKSLLVYANVVRYFIEMLWTKQEFSNVFNYQDIKRATERFGITARLSSCAYKQAKEIVNSQIKKSKRKRRMPRFKKVVANLDSRFFAISPFRGSFNWALKLSSGLPSIVIPFNNTKHTLKFINSGWILGNSIRIGVNQNKEIWIDLIFEKAKPEKKKEGRILAVDLGYRSLLATSDGKLIGTELKDKIKKIGKRRKRSHYYIRTEINRYLKQLKLDDVKLLVLENLRNVKKNKRGKFSRNSNRLLSFWHYSQALDKLRQICEERGIGIEFKSPYKTSQRCPYCGKIDRRNRNGERFRCIYCGFEEHADIVGAKNLELLGLAGVYSLRSLQGNFIGVHKCL